MASPLVSIIIPIYNSEKYVCDAINAARAQTYQNKEIIIIDDGSTDNSYKIAKGFECENVIIIKQDNQGASSARNTGMSIAKGKYIQFLDADDLISENKIEEQIKLIGTKEDSLSTCSCIYFFDGSDHQGLEPKHEWYQTGSTDPLDFIIKLYGGSLIGSEYGGMLALHTWLIPSALIKKVGGWNETLSLDDDGEFMCRIILEANEIKYAKSSEVFYRKYLTTNNLSNQTSYTACASLLESNKLKKNLILEKTDSQNAKSALGRVFLEIAVSFYPKFPLLTREAESIAYQLDHRQKQKPYTKFPLKYVSLLFGWKTAKTLSILKTKWIRKIS